MVQSLFILDLVIFSVNCWSNLENSSWFNNGFDLKNISEERRRGYSSNKNAGETHESWFFGSTNLFLLDFYLQFDWFRFHYDGLKAQTLYWNW